jgi:hypothetical protein
MQEDFDLGSLDCIHYGTAIFKTIWNCELGDILSEDDNGEYITEGDFELTGVSPKDFYIDPDAKTWKQVRYVFQKYVIPYEEAVYRFAKDKDTGEIDKKKIAMLENYRRSEVRERDRSSVAQTSTVEIFEYWEKGLPCNGYAGRYAVCGRNGGVISEVTCSPYQFTKARKSEGFKRARLPFHIFTDIDKPGRVWGRSFLDYVVRPQDVLNKLDSVVLDNLQANGVMRVILPEGTEIAADSLTNSPWDIVKITGSQPPHYMSPPQLSPDMSRYRDQIRQGIDDMSGVNESMFGQQSRETAGFAMQYAVNQGSAIRRRLFNKYAMVTEAVWKDYLDLIRMNWDEPQLVSVLGKEKAMESKSIKGSDIDGGFDIIVEYGTALSIDPVTRREELMQMQQFFTQAGVPPRTVLKLMRLNELEELQDQVEIAERRQREYIDQIISKGKYVPPEVFEDHENMLVYCKFFFNTSEFKALDDEIKGLIRRHFIDRIRMPAEETKLVAPKAPAAPAAPAPAMPAGLPAAPGLPMAPAGAEGGEMPPLGQ